MPAPNISVNTDRCKRRFAPPAAAGYFNRWVSSFSLLILPLLLAINKGVLK